MLDHSPLFFFVRGWSPFASPVMSPTLLCSAGSCFLHEQHLIRSFPGQSEFVFLPGFSQDTITRLMRMYGKSEDGA